MKKTVIVIAIAVTPAATALADVQLDLQAQAQCERFATTEEPTPPEAEAACLVNASRGLPSAQFALGALLLSHQKYSEGQGWLEKAAAAHHPPASQLLGELYLQADDKELQARGKELLRYAVCAGYPPALASEHKAALGPIDCGSTAPASFDGTWDSQLNWIKGPPAGGKADQLRVVVNAGTLKVFLRSGGDWIETKPGKFHLLQVDDTLEVSAIDSGWDLDGKWVESWSIHLLRVAPDRAVMNFGRTVNNIYLPEAFGFKTFSTVAEGQATRVSK